MKMIHLFSILGVARSVKVFGNNVEIPNGELFPSLSDDTRFERTCLGSASSRTFTITNDGNAELLLGASGGSGVSGVVVSSDSPSFTIMQQPPATLQPGQSASFEASFTPQAPGHVNAVLQLASSSGAIQWGVAGEGVAPLVEVQQLDNGRPAHFLDFGLVDPASTSNPDIRVYALNREECVTSVQAIEITSQKKDGQPVASNAFAITAVPLPYDLPRSQRLFFNLVFSASDSGLYSSKIVVRGPDGEESFAFDIVAQVPTASPAAAPTVQPVSPTPWTPELWTELWSFTLSGTTYYCNDYAKNQKWCPTDFNANGIGACEACSECSQVEECKGETGFVFPGCDGGTGSFTTTLTKMDDEGLVGFIPIDQVGLVVNLTAKNDLDIRIYDQDDTSKWPSGQAIVAWCEDSSTCNIGKLSGATSSSVVYRDMQIDYSGFNGVNGEKGHEWIQVDQVKVPLMMQAYAFVPGSVKVDYAWTKTVTSCCMGTAACGDNFERNVPYDAILDLGEIPQGVTNLTISLESTVDIDIQLYDLDSSDEAIIKWCDPNVPACKAGVLGMAPDQQSTEYNGLTYEYSGYNGVGGKAGDEWIKIVGTTNTRLFMKVFGFASGPSKVSYTYWHPKAEAQ